MSNKRRRFRNRGKRKELERIKQKEQQRIWDKLANDPTATKKVSEFDLSIVSMVRRTVPDIFANEIASVQPMTIPSGMTHDFKKDRTLETEISISKEKIRRKAEEETLGKIIVGPEPKRD